VLDFGLAKLSASETSESPSGESKEISTATEQLTDAGAALGTAEYMSPEQVSNQSLDRRSDLFSFGALVYEMATGVAAFRGNSPAEIFEAILNKTPVSPVKAKWPSTRSPRRHHL
jgi:serine/threonine protein kinase